jgi:hypothetical protein
MAETTLPAEHLGIEATTPAYQAYQILRLGFTAAPMIAGLDKFANILVQWNMYLAPLVPRMTGISGPTLMRAFGVIEVLAGVAVAIKPRYAAYVVAAWLWGIIINLLLIPGYYDIALRDFGLSLGALALARLAQDFNRR